MLNNKKKLLIMSKNVLVIFSENFADDNREYGYISSVHNRISKEYTVPVKVSFHNKKTGNLKDLKTKISKRPDAILFDNCGKATVKKVTSSLCNKVKDKISMFSYNSDHQVSGVKKIKTMSEIYDAL